jgi:oxygen-independent coproporphyrinogen III oxidase
MMMGLRLTDEGIYEDQFFKRFSLNLAGFYSKEISRLIDRKLIEWVEIGERRRLRLTRGGRLLGNQVFMEFILD